MSSCVLKTPCSYVVPFQKKEPLQNNCLYESKDVLTVRAELNIWSIALTLLLMIVFGFLTLIIIIYNSKEIVEFKY